MKYYANELYHFGILGMKWGVRNYQNKDGSYTAKGAAENGGAGRYSKETHSKMSKSAEKYSKEASKKYNLGKLKEEYMEEEEDNSDKMDFFNDDFFTSHEAKEAYEEAKKAADEYVKDKLIKEYGEMNYEDYVEENKREKERGKEVINVVSSLNLSSLFEPSVSDDIYVDLTDLFDDWDD